MKDHEINIPFSTIRKLDELDPLTIDTDTLNAISTQARQERDTILNQTHVSKDQNPDMWDHMFFNDCEPNYKCDHHTGAYYDRDVFKNNKEIMLAAVKNNGGALKYASAALKADKDIVLAAVQNHGQALGNASAALKADKDIILAAVQDDGWALCYASAALQNDKDIVLAAVQHDSAVQKFGG